MIEFKLRNRFKIPLVVCGISLIIKTILILILFIHIHLKFNRFPDLTRPELLPIIIPYVGMLLMLCIFYFLYKNNKSHKLILNDIMIIYSSKKNRIDINYSEIRKINNSINFSYKNNILILPSFLIIKNLEFLKGLKAKLEIHNKSFDFSSMNKLFYEAIYSDSMKSMILPYIIAFPLIILIGILSLFTIKCNFIIQFLTLFSGVIIILSIELTRVVTIIISCKPKLNIFPEQSKKTIWTIYGFGIIALIAILIVVLIHS